MTRLRFRTCLPLAALLLAPLPAYPQTTLTGAMQFSTNSTGGASGGQVWNTLGGDSYFDLWLALSADAGAPVNGPADTQAGIAIPLETGDSYTFHIFGQPGCCDTGFNGLNLFFDGNNSTPGISVFGAIGGTGFLPDGNGTLTLAATPATGSGTTIYSSNEAIVVLNGYNWNAPQTPPGDVCQSFLFSPGDGPDNFGSFSLKVWPAADLSLSQSSGSPGTKLTIAGSGFAPTETVDISANHPGAPPLLTVSTDASGAFSVTARGPQAPHGPMEIFATGQSSGKLGAAAFFVTPALVMSPGIVSPGGTTSAFGVGFGAGETVDIYWDNPRQLLGTATANGQGSGALTITVPQNASPGIDEVIGIGQITNAIGIGKVAVR